MNQDTNKAACSVIILAAGYSGRFGQPKPLLAAGPETTFLQKIVSTYGAFACDSIVVVVNELIDNNLKEYYPLLLPEISLVVNHQPELERFHSLRLGLQALPELHSCFIQNGDQPFVNAQLLGSLLQAAEPNAFVVPVYQGKGGHPIWLSPEICADLLAVEDDQKLLNDLLSSFRRINVHVEDPLILADINTPLEYLKYFGHLPTQVY